MNNTIMSLSKYAHTRVSSLLHDSKIVGLCVLLLCAIPHAMWAGALTIDSISTQPSDCLNDGTATLYVSGGDSSVPYEYALDTLGSTAYQWQNSKNFYSLSPGNYQVTARDITGQQVTQMITITGNYSPAVINHVFTTAPSCPDGQDASVEIQYTPGSRPDPYFTLYDSAGTTVVAGPQLSPIFGGLSAGTYTCQVTDSCGIYVNYVAIIAPNTSPSLILKAKLDSVGCDSSTVKITGNNASLPITVEYFALSAPSQVTTLQSSSSSVLALLPNDSVHISITDACGRTDSAIKDLSQVTTGLQVFSNNCGYSFRFAHTAFYCDSIVYAYKLLTDSVWTYSSSKVTPVLAPGTYEAKIINTCCNTEYLNTINIMSVDRTVNVTVDPSLYNCVDSTTAIRVSFKNAHNLKVVYKGPALDTLTGTADNNSQTFLPLIHLDDTLNTKVQTTLEEFSVVNLPLGTYTFEYWDDCDTAKKTLQVDVTSVKNYDPFATLTTGCPGDNTISLGVGSGSYFTRAKIQVTRLSDQTLIHNANSYGQDTVVLNSLPADDYEIKYSYTGSNKSYYNKAYSCPSPLIKTIHIAPYQLPQITASHEYNCGNGQATLIAQASGQSPMTYAIREKGTSAFGPMQSSHIFLGVDTAKIYEVQVTDVCGNNGIAEINDLGALPHPQIFTGTDCINNTGSASYVVLSTFSYIGAQYTWTDSAHNPLAYTADYHMSPIVPGTYWAHAVIPGANGSICVQDSADVVIVSNHCDAISVNLAEQDWNMQSHDCQNILTYNNHRSSGIQAVWLQRRNTQTEQYQDIAQINISAQLEEVQEYQYADVDFDTKGTQEYRLRLEMLDQTMQYTHTVSLANTCNNLSALEAAKIYPNPSQGKITLSLPADHSEQALYLEIYDAMGKLQKRIDLAAYSQGHTSIDLSDLSAGIYLVALVDPQGVHRLSTPLELL